MSTCHYSHIEKLKNVNVDLSGKLLNPNTFRDRNRIIKEQTYIFRTLYYYLDGTRKNINTN